MTSASIGIWALAVFGMIMSGVAIVLSEKLKRLQRKLRQSQGKEDLEVPCHH